MRVSRCFLPVDGVGVGLGGDGERFGGVLEAADGVGDELVDAVRPWPGRELGQAPTNSWSPADHLIRQSGMWRMAWPPWALFGFSVLVQSSRARFRHSTVGPNWTMITRASACSCMSVRSVSSGLCLFQADVDGVDGDGLAGLHGAGHYGDGRYPAGFPDQGGLVPDGYDGLVAGVDWGVDHGVPEPGVAGDAGDDHVGIFDDGGLVGEEMLVPECLLDPGSESRPSARCRRTWG